MEHTLMKGIPSQTLEVLVWGMFEGYVGKFLAPINERRMKYSLHKAGKINSLPFPDSLRK